MIDKDIDLGRFFELATNEKIYVNGLNLHEIKNEILIYCKSDFEFSGSMVIRPVERKTKTRFKNREASESYINAIDIDYDSEDVTFTGYIKKNTPQFNRLNRSQYGRGKNFKQDIDEYIGNNKYIPTSGNCFIKRIKYFTKNDYTEEF